MLIRNRYLFLVCILAAFVFGQLAWSQKESLPTTALASLIEQAERGLSPVAERAEWEDSPPLQYIRSNASQYSRAAIEMLQDSTVSEERKVMIVFTMQRLPLHRYVAFVEACLDLRKAGKLQTTILRRAAIPGAAWSTQMETNYHVPAVRNLYKRLIESGYLNKDEIIWLQLIMEGKAPRP